MIIENFRIVVKEHKGNWYSNGYTIELPYELKPGDFFFSIWTRKTWALVNEIINITDESITVFSHSSKKGITIFLDPNVSIRYEPFPMFLNKPDFRNKTNLDFYFGNLAGSWAAERKKDEWQRNFNNVMFRQLSMF